MHARLLHFVMLTALVAALVIAPVWGPVASAQSLIDRRQPREQYRNEPQEISQDEAVSRAESRYRAKAVKVERVRDGDHVTYQIRLLNAEGKVWTVRVDAATGRMN
jgi:uncharacterized membrane protein YkoI